MKKSLGAKTLICPAPVWAVGSYDKQGKPNVMTIAWGGICCSAPPCVTVSLRKATYTYESLMERKAFTINVPDEKHARQVDYFGLVSGKTEDKFKESGLTPIKSDLVDAPYIKEFPLVLECKLIKTVELGLHTQFIGEIMDVKADESVLDDEGLLDMKKVLPLIYSIGTASYYGIGQYIGKGHSMGKKK
jgi:flavin reductase (DIM6/NTAB) family NADH-FMN oxidoreductase RutF